MRNYKKIFSILFFMLLLCSLCFTSSAAKNQKKTGWINNGNNTYYRTESGKLIKNKEIQIGKYKYRFDKNGRLVKKNITSGIYVIEYDKKTGRYVDTYVDLQVTTTDKDTILAKSIKKANGTKSLFMISKKGTSVINKKGKKTSFSKLKKNTKFRVYFNDKYGILESYPSQFAAILKVQIK